MQIAPTPASGASTTPAPTGHMCVRSCLNICQLAFCVFVLEDVCSEYMLDSFCLFGTEIFLVFVLIAVSIYVLVTALQSALVTAF